MITNAEEKKIFCQCILKGESYPFPGIHTEGQEDDIKPTKSIKNTPKGTEKRSLRDRQLCTNTETVGHFHIEVEQLEQDLRFSEQTQDVYIALSIHINCMF